MKTMSTLIKIILFISVLTVSLAVLAVDNATTITMPDEKGVAARLSDYGHLDHPTFVVQAVAGKTFTVDGLAKAIADSMARADRVLGGPGGISAEAIWRYLLELLAGDRAAYNYAVANKQDILKLLEHSYDVATLAEAKREETSNRNFRNH